MQAPHRPDAKTPTPAASTQSFSDAERAAVYRAIHERRDMRHFSGGSVSDEVLLRLLRAAHHGPSVGFMQPWRFIRVTSGALREGIHALVEQERGRTAEALGERKNDFMKLKVQGVLDAAEVLVVALPPGREAHIFGRRTLPEMDIASTACAIQNLWLAARAENLGMGWVSLFDPAALAQLLQMPAGAHPLAVLCLGPVTEFYARPMLEQEKWATRAPLQQMLMDNVWAQESRLEAESDAAAPPDQLPRD
ncbi:5,6-dimethylbenzimidazole synthase [Diaphorobacter caeni]|uniref:5,6-dimethylbenzimidazole synthase n=1 Tax=Diaphorobacter caeni TaxID=2784387 RepID=UPI00188EF947|nr:5,6-dimethylbenzimidazole synthase [Diaphorobacter caeni]MBF5007641.1 5,6-dimethylbenzimidazole synthase [Diaphorobacter caeni]